MKGGKPGEDRSLVIQNYHVNSPRSAVVTLFELLLSATSVSSVSLW